MKEKGTPYTSAYSGCRRRIRPGGRRRRGLAGDGVAHAAQPAPDHLLAQQLRAEGAHAQDVGDGAGVPAFGEHGDRDDALDLFTQPALFANRVHHFAQQVFIGQRIGVPAGETRLCILL